MASQTSELQSTLLRLSRVERRNRRLKLSGIIALVGTRWSFSYGSSEGSERARCYRGAAHGVRGQSSKGVAALGLGLNGSPLLVMTRKDGKLGATTLEVASEGIPALTLYAKDTKPRVMMALDFDDFSGLVLSERNGFGRVGLAVANEGSGGLVLYGENKRPTASFRLATNWSPFLVNEKFYDRHRTLGWAGLAVEGLEMHRLPSDHESYNREHMPVAANKLRECLQRAEAGVN